MLFESFLIYITEPASPPDNCYKPFTAIYLLFLDAPAITIFLVVTTFFKTCSKFGDYELNLRFELLVLFWFSAF